MSEWEEYQLDEVIERFIDYRGKTPNKVTSGIPLITAKVIKDGTILPPDEFIEPDEYLSWMTRGLPKINDVLLTTEAPLGEVALVQNENIALAQRIILLRGKSDFVDNRFLFYSLQTGLMQHRLSARASGSTVQGIKSAELKKVLIPLPDVKIQKEIVLTLSCLDRKIENLRKQNETLEAIAQTLFKHWFVDFEFSNEDGKPYKSSGGEMVRSELGEIPAGWCVAPFETTFLIPLRNGLTRPRSVRGEGFYMVNMGELFANKRIGDLEMDRVQLSISECEKSLLEVGDILFARQSLVREGAGQCSIITDASEPRTFEGHLIRCRIDRRKANPFYFFYHFWSFSGSFQMRSLVEQVAAAGIRGSELAKLEMLMPPVEFQDKFFAVIEPLEKSIALNFRRIRTLTKTRDVLLPKLMSGKLRITAS